MGFRSPKGRQDHSLGQLGQQIDSRPRRGGRMVGANFRQLNGYWSEVRSQRSADRGRPVKQLTSDL